VADRELHVALTPANGMTTFQLLPVGTVRDGPHTENSDNEAVMATIRYRPESPVTSSDPRQLPPTLAPDVTPEPLRDRAQEEAASQHSASTAVRPARAPAGRSLEDGRHTTTIAFVTVGIGLLILALPFLLLGTPTLTLGIVMTWVLGGLMIAFGVAHAYRTRRDVADLRARRRRREQRRRDQERTTAGYRPQRYL